MMPAFDLQGGFPLCAARSLSVGGLLSVFGALTFRCVVAPKAFARMPPDEVARGKSQLRLIALSSAAVGLLGFCIWLFVQAWLMADAHGAGQALAAIPAVLRDTDFGRVIVAQIIVLAVVLALTGLPDRPWRQRTALALAALALLLQAGHSHAFSMYAGPSLLLAADMLHLAAAGAWLGGLVPLIAIIRLADPKAGALTARSFSPLGKWCVAALVLTACFQGWVLVASIPGLVGTAYGWMVLVKLFLFGVLLCFALVNRHRFAPALLHGDGDAARRVLIRSILAQSGFAAAIIVAAVVLSTLPPSMHGQPVWPFAERFSLAAVSEDPDFRREVIEAGLALLGAAAIVGVSFVFRRFRVGACVLTVVIAWFAIPHLDLLLVTAYPTSFYHSQTGFSSDSVVAGQGVFAANCVACHGTEGRGDGPYAKTLPVPPANLTAAHLWMHSDGELYWWVSHGIKTPEGAQAMPGFAPVLTDDQIWGVIDYIRAHNAGVARSAMQHWTHTVKAPGFTATCGRKDFRSSDLLGQFVLLRFGASPDLPVAPGLVTVVADAGDQAVRTGVCVTRDETVPRAYAIVSGLDVAHLAGAMFLIDGQGWLRDVSDEPAFGWAHAATLEGEIQYLRGHARAEPPAAPMNMNMNMNM